MSQSGAQSSSVYNILLFSFEGAGTAQDIVKQAQAADLLADYSVIARAVVERDADGKVHIHEPGHGGIGGAIGAVAGGLAGLFLGPVAVLALAVTGGVLGGVAGHFAGREIPADDLKQAAQALPPNSSAVLVLIEDTEAERMIDSMSDYHANVVTLTVGDELSGVIGSMVAVDVEGTTPTSSNDAGAAASQPAKPAPETSAQSAGATPTS